ncbi:hypothetical protein IAU59_007327 [Kwoniella sp. CBS 9459]
MPRSAFPSQGTELNSLPSREGYESRLSSNKDLLSEAQHKLKFEELEVVTLSAAASSAVAGGMSSSARSDLQSRLGTANEEIEQLTESRDRLMEAIETDEQRIAQLS